MRALVTGGTGLLGAKVVERLARMGWETFAAARHPADTREARARFVPLDVASAESVQAAFDRCRPALVIHAAAMADVDACERAPDLAHAINARGAALIAAACRATSARLVYVSTDYVFDGERGPYAEDDPTNPLSVYARTKLVGEAAVRQALPDAIIARTAVLFGLPRNGRPNLALWLLERLQRGEPAPAATDQVGSPTLADNLAEMLVALALSNRSGVYHTAGATIESRYSFCRRAAEVFGYDPELVRPILSASIPRPARRPRHSGLVIEKLRRECPQVTPLTSQQALEALRDQLRRTESADSSP